MARACCCLGRLHVMRVDSNRMSVASRKHKQDVKLQLTKRKPFIPRMKK